MTVARYYITSFLEEFDNHLKEGNYLLVKRVRTDQTLTSLEFTTKNLLQELVTLTIEDFSSGPEPNDDFDGYVMIFGKNICGQEIYIKIATTDQTGVTRMAVCISFHDADYPLKYPYK